MNIFTCLFYNPSVFNEDNLPQLNIVIQMSNHPVLKESRKAVSRKAASLDGIPVEILRYGNNKPAVEKHHMISGLFGDTCTSRLG